MQELTVYLIKMTCCSAVLLLHYYLFLRNTNHHQYNRFYLLSAVVMSFVFPLISIPVFCKPDHPTLYTQTLQAITVTNRLPGKGFYFLPYLLRLILSSYLLTSAYLFMTLILSFVRINKLSHRYAWRRLDTIKFYHTTEQNTPFSFFRKIFWNDQIQIESPEGKQVFKHELFHARQLHSLDNVFLQLALCVAWFNPFFHIIRKELRATHEFGADQFAVTASAKHDYAAYLVAHAFKQAHSIPIAHYFFYSLFKRRIAMILHHSNSSRFSHARKLVAIPSVLFIFFSLAMQPTTTRPVKDLSNTSIMDTTGPNILLKPEVEASYPGGARAWQLYLTKTLRYPQSAQDAEIQGAVVVQFIVEKDGTLRDVKAISGPAQGGLKEEGVRVLQNSGTWVPANDHGQIVVAYKRQPIVFRLEKQ